MKLLRKRKRAQGASQFWPLSDNYLLQRYLSAPVIGVTRPAAEPVSALKCFKTSGAPLLVISGDEQGGVGIWQEQRHTNRNGNINNSNSTEKTSALTRVSYSQGHTKTINCIALSPTHPARYVTASNDSTLKLWQDNHNCVRTFRDHTSFVNSCHFDDSGRLIASVGLDSTLRLWHEDSPNTVFLLHLRDPAFQVQFLPLDFYLLMTASKGGVHIWDLRRHSSYLELLEPHMPIDALNAQDTSISFTWDSKPEEMTSMVWGDTNWATTTTPLFGSADAPPYADILQMPDEPAASLDQEPPKVQRVFDKHLRVYSRPFQPHKKDKVVYSAICTHSGRHVITSATDDSHKVWDSTELKGLWTLEALSHYTESVLTSDDSYLISGSTDGNLYVWQVYGGGEGKFCAQMKVHSYPVTALCISDDDTTLISADAGGYMKLVSLS